MHLPVVEFTDSHGTKQRIQLKQDDGAYATGYPVKLLYSPSDPANAMMDSFGSVWGLGIGLTLTGVVLAGVAIGAWATGASFGINGQF
jgi:hypothetical protein